MIEEQQSTELRLEIAHVLFIDIVGYSKLLMDEQRESIAQLNEVVRATEQFRRAETAGRLTKIPTGDGMALVFSDSPESPVQCAQQISRALREHPQLQLRMGVHSGPISGVIDVTDRANMAGAGMNIAHRVMDCGDAGHILLSKRVADDLERYGRWHSCLHEIGECEVKHGVRVHLVNLHGDGFGNPALPSRVRDAGKIARQQARKPWFVAAVALLLAALAVVVWQFGRRSAQRNTRVVEAKSIAVLPFANLSTEQENAFFTDGVQDEILTHLARLADLKVISRTSVMHYTSSAQRNLRQIGKELGVAHLLEGSVQRAGNKVRVIAQLIDARNDGHLWAETYDRDLADVFAIQSEIAKAIAEQLQAKLSPTETRAIEQGPTADVAAFELYSKAKTLMLTTGEGGAVERALREAIELLESATTRDPAFHAAYCQLVLAHDTLYSRGYDHTAPRLDAAEAALRKAEQLRPNSSETHLALAQHLFSARRDSEGTLRALELATLGLPHDPRILQLTGLILLRQGKPEESVRALEEAATLDPRNVTLFSWISSIYGTLRRYGEAAAALDRAVSIKPDDFALGIIRRQVDFYWRADAEPMCELVERVRAERPAAVLTVADNWFDCALSKRDWAAAEQALVALGDNPSSPDAPVILSRQFGEGLLARATQDEARARRAFTAARLAQEQIVQQQRDYGPALCVLGLIDAALGNKEAALAEGRRAMELFPVQQNPLHGQKLVAYFALIAAWTGEKDLALEQLATALSRPSGAHITHYGALKLLPYWDPLRGDPRFEQIVASLAPKD